MQVSRREDALTIVALCAYDGLNRRIRKDVTNTGIAIVPGSDAGGATGISCGDRVERYYYAGWRVVEETDNATTSRTLAQPVDDIRVTGETPIPPAGPPRAVYRRSSVCYSLFVLRHSLFRAAVRLSGFRRVGAILFRQAGEPGGCMGNHDRSTHNRWRPAIEQVVHLQNTLLTKQRHPHGCRSPTAPPAQIEQTRGVLDDAVADRDGAYEGEREPYDATRRLERNLDRLRDDSRLCEEKWRQGNFIYSARVGNSNYEWMP